MTHYIAWMKTAYWITTTFRPAISVPAGFTAEGLPVGIQTGVQQFILVSFPGGSWWLTAGKTG